MRSAVAASDEAIEILDVAFLFLGEKNTRWHQGWLSARRLRMRAKDSAAGRSLPSSTCRLVSANTFRSASVSCFFVLADVLKDGFRFSVKRNDDRLRIVLQLPNDLGRMRLEVADRLDLF
jgi:hypothetical protein